MKPALSPALVADTDLQFNELTRTDGRGLVQNGESTVAWIENATDGAAMPDVPNKFDGES